jgi:hypothetical protein
MKEDFIDVVLLSPDYTYIKRNPKVMSKRAEALVRELIE